MSEDWIIWLTAVSVVTFVVSLVTLPWLVSQIPADYFLHDQREPAHWREAHPVVRLCLLVGKNLLGVLLFLGGIIMLFVPGQGLLTIAMGLVLMDYPGKYQLERWIVSHHSVLKGLNWLRRLRGTEPLKVDP